jgi:hypothetical protein
MSKWGFGFHKSQTPIYTLGNFPKIYRRIKRHKIIIFLFQPFWKIGENNYLSGSKIFIFEVE